MSKSLKTAFLHGRDVGHAFPAFCTGDRQCPDLAGLHLLERDLCTDEKHVDASRQQIGHRFGDAPVLHHKNIRAGLRFHDLGGNMARRADSCRGVRQLALVLSWPSAINSGTVFAGTAGFDDQRLPEILCRQRNVREILHGVVFDVFVERWNVGMRRGGEEPRVAIRRLRGDVCGTNHTAGARTIVDDERLPQRRGRA